jgi:NitT/TauT family transport system ATP-binding protein
MWFECRNLSKTYRTRNGMIRALEEGTFCVGEHEFLCIVGPSGCGKTTLLKIIAGLLQPSSGEILFHDLEANGSLRSALVFQDHGLLPWRNVLDNTAFGLEMQRVGKAERQARALAFLEKVGLGPFTRTYPHELSMGMRQRVGIARAFVSNPQILLMDEPFGSLDSQTRQVLREELLKVWKENRKSVVYVTHDIEEAVVLGDRVLVMTGRPGRLRAVIPVPLDRPRDLAAGDQPRIAEIKWKIWKMLEDEVRTSLRISS